MVSLCASPSTSPSAITTAPTGTSSRTEAARARRRAASIPAKSLGDGVPLRTGQLGHHRARRLGSLKPEPVSVAFHPDSVALVEVSFQELERNGVLQQPLDHPLEWTRPIDRVVPFSRQKRLGLRRELQREVTLSQHPLQPLQLQVDDLHQIFPA